MKFNLILTLELPNLSHLTNDPIYHSPWWSTIPTKLLSGIPKFNKNRGEGQSNNIVTYHLSFSWNHLNDEFIHLCPF